MTLVSEFRDLCRRHGLAATHQRQVIYETVMSLPGHPSAELVYGKVRRQIPSISLATVYKNIRIFLDSGILQEVSLHYGSLRVEPNLRPHHHVVCVRCKTVTDLDETELEPVRLKHKLPRGFQLQRIAVDVLGVCENCSAKEHKSK
jgi:Fur family transcriptional regulator, peroxide stress response regulator